MDLGAVTSVKVFDKNSDGMKPPLIYAGVVELVDSMDLGSITLVVCGFESRRPHQKESAPN